MDKEAREKIAENLINMLLVEKTGVKLPLNHYALNIFTGLKKLGYGKLPQEKPPLLSDEELARLFYGEEYKRDMRLPWYLLEPMRKIAQAQLDICIEHYEGE